MKVLQAAFALASSLNAISYAHAEIYERSVILYEIKHITFEHGVVGLGNASIEVRYTDSQCKVICAYLNSDYQAGARLNDLTCSVEASTGSGMPVVHLEGLGRQLARVLPEGAGDTIVESLQTLGRVELDDSAHWVRISDHSKSDESLSFYYKPEAAFILR